MRCLLNIFDIHPCQNSTHKWLKYFLKTIKRLFPKIHGFSCLWRPGAQKTALGTRSARHSLPEFIKTSAWLCLILIDSLSCRSRGTGNLPTLSILKWNSVLPPWCTALCIVMQFVETFLLNSLRCFDPLAYKLLPVSPSYSQTNPLFSHSVHEIR